MSKIDLYKAELQNVADWQTYLMEYSCLPSPRANLELAYAVAGVSDRTKAAELIAVDRSGSTDQSPESFVVMCGLMALGKYAGADPSVRPVLRKYASDLRWRIREGIAMSLQLWGDVDMNGVLQELSQWAAGNPYEQRAAVAAVCEPRLLKDPAIAAAALRLLDAVTESYALNTATREDAYRVLTLGLSYGWSVAVAALPDVGKLLMEKWIASPGEGVRRVMRENLTKKRLEKMDAAWVEQMKTRTG